MSAWGNKDDIASPGTVALAGLTVTGTGTFFANNYSAGDVIRIADAGGDAVIKSTANATSLTLVSNTELTTGTLTGKQYTVSEKPIYVIDTDTNITGSEVFGVSTAEQGVATANTNHAGWVRIADRYTDADGNIRQKTETLVAMSSISGDAADDTDLPDS
tara:strand:+ start:197 stop:676 length:480 start_codon:yes stop_codon:yes gene_type:complete